MATKHLKLYEHGSGKTIIVTETKLREMESAPTFNRVFRKDGAATTEEVATFNAKAREEGSEDEALVTDSPKATKPAGSALPAGNKTPSQSAGTTGAAGTQGAGNAQSQAQGSGS